uniref:Small ribosomal subunit protein uS2c n=1 Tax=Blidingia minima TaxID=63414 RepID=A0A2Z4M9L2_9CHLO|nr:ribosomal protein S2 [Blidingia minima]AWX53168.1 ribosomal protein S2 [Blidingia minima]QPF96271.1 ribosomal protein S2 [Blidingia minima]QUX32861.1 ribosomal protein S2 [Blidingia minima]
MSLCFRHQVLKPKARPVEMSSDSKRAKNELKVEKLNFSKTTFFPKRHKKTFEFMKPNLNILHSNKQIVKLLVENRNYLGHTTTKWNPKMKPFLRQQNVTLFVGKKRKAYAHVLDPLKTLSHINYLSVTLSKAVLAHKNFLFVGTKGQYKGIISKTANLCASYFITEKWLGGFLTNWQTVSTLIVLLRKYDILIARGILDGMYKKEAAKAYKERNRLYRLLEGVKYMRRRPDLVVVMGQLNEATVLDECKKIHIPSICLVDSNCSPRISNFVLPINDDSTRSLNPFLEVLINSIKRGQLLLFNKNKPKRYDLIYPQTLGVPTKYKNRKKYKPKYRAKNKYKNKAKIEVEVENFYKTRVDDVTAMATKNKVPTTVKTKGFQKRSNSNSKSNVQPQLTYETMTKKNFFNEKLYNTKFLENKKRKSLLNSNVKDSCLREDNFAFFNLNPKISKTLHLNLTTLPNNLSPLCPPNELPTKKLKIQGFINNELNVRVETNHQQALTSLTSQIKKKSMSENDLN